MYEARGMSKLSEYSLRIGSCLWFGTAFHLNSEFIVIGLNAP